MLKHILLINNLGKVINKNPHKLVIRFMKIRRVKVSLVQHQLLIKKKVIIIIILNIKNLTKIVTKRPIGY